MTSDPKLEAYRFTIGSVRATRDAARRHAEQCYESNFLRIAAFMDEWERLKDAHPRGKIFTPFIAMKGSVADLRLESHLAAG